LALWVVDLGCRRDPQPRGDTKMHPVSLLYITNRVSLPDWLDISAACSLYARYVWRMSTSRAKEPDMIVAI
jgi:hypothetical protein